MRWYTDIFSNNTYTRKDYTYQNLSNIIQNKDIAFVKVNKNLIQLQ